MRQLIMDGWKIEKKVVFTKKPNHVMVLNETVKNDANLWREIHGQIDSW